MQSIVIEDGNAIFGMCADFLMGIRSHKLIRNFSTSSRIEIGRDVEILGSSCFSSCYSLSSVSFESESRLIRIESSAFSYSSLESIIIPRTVEILCSECFSSCKSLSSISFESDSRLTRIESSAFSSSSLQSIIIPRNVEILCSSCFSFCSSLSSISFESKSRLTRIEWHACAASHLMSIAIPPMISFIDAEAFWANCEIHVLKCDSCVELARWSARHCHSGLPSDCDSAVDFRRTLRVGCDLPILSDCLVNLSEFEDLGVLGVGCPGSSHLYRRRSDGIQFVVELIGRFESGNENGRESGIEKEIEKWLNLKHRCIAAPIGFAVSGGGAVELRAVRPYAEDGSLAEVLARPPPRWTATAKAIAVVGLALGLRFLNGVGHPHGRLRPNCVLFEGGDAIQIAGIGAVRSGGGGCDAEFMVPEIESGAAPTAKADAFSFARIVSRIAADNRPTRTVPKFVADLIADGLSAQPSHRPSFGAIIVRLEAKRFEIEEGVNSEAVWAFVRAVEAAEP
jgi:hypothetical protein